MSNKLLAQISRAFLAKKQVYQYRMTSIQKMDDQSAIQLCYLYCEENNLKSEFETYRRGVESEYAYCPYLQDYISEGCCYDMQMIKNGLIKPSALPDIPIDKEKLETMFGEVNYGS